MLTKRRKEILDFVRAFTNTEGYSPSLEEIKKHLSLSSVSTVHYHVKKLEQSGYIQAENRRARKLHVSSDTIASQEGPPRLPVIFSVPVYGYANAGPATLFAEENLIGYVKIPDSLHGKKDHIFAVEVQGNSMDRANISGKNLEEGDFALIDSQHRQPGDGDYILSIIDGCANLKKFKRHSKTGAIQLLSESSDESHKPIYISSEEKYMVNGKVIFVVKK